MADSGDAPESARSLSVRGIARIDIVDGVTDEYIAPAYRTYGHDDAVQFETNVRQLYTQQARITIDPTRARFYDFGAGRMQKFLTEMVQQN